MRGPADLHEERESVARQSHSTAPKSSYSGSASSETGITPVVSHASYLINLATTFPALREQSIAAFIDEIDRAEALGLLGVVIHPGTCTAGPRTRRCG